MQALQKLCTAIAVLAAITISAQAAEPPTMTWNINGAQREALIFAPTASTKSGTSPLVFVFHGHGGTMQNISRSMHIQTNWPEAIVIYMQGVPTPTRIDPEGKRAGWQRALGEVGDRDLKFFDAVLASMRKKFSVNDKRIYAAGFSNGSLFTFLLWAERPNVFERSHRAPGRRQKASISLFPSRSSLSPARLTTLFPSKINSPRSSESASSTGQRPPANPATTARCFTNRVRARSFEPSSTLPVTSYRPKRRS
jgi:hypothetical protein